MKFKKKLVIIHPSQYGLAVDYLKYCETLSNIYEIIYFCLDEKRPKIQNNEIKIIYTTTALGYFISHFFFIVRVSLYILTHQAIIMVAYNKIAFIYKILFPYRKMILNIRSQSVNPILTERNIENNKIRKVSSTFDHIIMISKEGADEIGLNPQKTHIVSLGADQISDKPKQYHNLKLLYVGTLNNRDISKTIDGLYLFIKSNITNCSISYSIVGDGNELPKIKERIKKHKLEKTVHTYGRVSYDKLKPFFDEHNIGISFIPITEYYDNQPPTKTYEYIMSGLYCFATATNANKKIINDINGIIIDDSPEAFAKALNHFLSVNEKLCFESIINTGKKYSWQNIIKNELLPVLEKL